MLNSSGTNGVEDVSDSGWGVSSIPDIHELWQDDRARPVKHTVHSYSIPSEWLQLDRMLCFNDPVLSSPAVTYNRIIPFGLINALRMHTQPTNDVVSVQSANLLTDLSTSPSTKLDTAQSSRTLVSSPSDGFLSGPRPERNRLWNSVRQSMSRFRSQFTRSGPFRASTGASSTRSIGPDGITPSVPHSLPKSNIVIEREYMSQALTSSAAPPTTNGAPVTGRPPLDPSASGLPPLHSPSGIRNVTDALLVIHN
ncbi:unnamed protein product [Echinostoma caproni]|uniref:DDHD domain-containing protein n=1 Tax=Echinostoma caproni TaxID=27848 RepID=A0A183B7L8_9TREM|nr:unnamed protein product [Echinostoma caproni]